MPSHGRRHGPFGGELDRHVKAREEKELAALRQELREKDGKISELSARLDAVGEKPPV